MRIAARVAQSKAQNPERFCPEPRCLYRTEGGVSCPRHAPKHEALARAKAAYAAKQEQEASEEAALLSRYEGALEAREPEGDVW